MDHRSRPHKDKEILIEKAIIRMLDLIERNYQNRKIIKGVLEEIWDEAEHQGASNPYC